LVLKNWNKTIIRYDIVFVSFFILYNFAIILEKRFFTGSCTHKGILIPESLFLKIVLLGGISLIGFYIGLYLSNIILKKCKTKRKIANKPLLEYTIWICLILPIILFLTLYRKQMGLLITNYDSSMYWIFNNPVFAYSKELFLFSYSIIIYLLVNVKKKLIWGILFTLILLIISFGVGDKDIILLAGIPWIPKINTLLKKIKLRINIKRVFVILFIVIVIPLLGFLFSNLTRNNIPLEELIKDIRNQGIYNGFDNSGPFYSLIDNLSQEDIDFKYGITYINGSLFWIPKFVWKDRPKSLSEEYAKRRISDWKPGQGLGYNLMSEAYINFGYLGGFIQYFLIAFLLIFFKRITFLAFKEEPNNIIQGIFYVWLIYNLITMHRGEFVLPSAFTRYLLPLLFVYYSLIIIKKTFRLLKSN
jgi:oligosaccharide repeat unit polymerase